MSLFFSRVVSTPLKVGVYVWLLLHYRKLAVSGFSNFLIDSSLISVGILYFFVMVFTYGSIIRLRGVKS